MATETEIRAAIEAIDRQLNRGVVKIADGERSINYDPETLRRRKAELLADLEVLVGRPQIVRRVLTYSTKGL